MTADDICALSLTEVAARIAARELSPVTVTEATLDRIARLDSTLNAFVTVMTDEAQESARLAETEIAAGQYRGPLHGVPISVKDLFLTKGIRTTAGSAVLTDHVPNRDAAVVRRLREAGAVIVGKTNLLEFAYGEIHPDFGATRNPWNPEFGTAGSSSGSGAAVAAGMGFGSIGSDTGGSIRGPAAYCGNAGLKPTYGLVSRAGGYPLSWTCDHMGPMTRTVRDCAILLDAIAGYDPDDPTSARRTPPSYVDGLDQMPERPTIGVLQRANGDTITDEVARTTDEVSALLTDHGYTTVPVDLPHPEHAARALLAIIYAEASAYHLPTLRTNPEGYAPNTRERLELGTMLPATISMQAMRARRVILEAYRDLFRRIDLLLLPVSPSPSYQLDAAPTGSDGAVDEGGDRILAALRFTGPFNLTGQPAISIPSGATVDGLPIGIQLVGRPFAETTVLSVATEIEAGMAHRLPRREGNPLVV
jgi:aspartyl-tRNA(Asn)/glutamyl-tRNA(Gln) amidotransferase subunit A